MKKGLLLTTNSFLKTNFYEENEISVCCFTNEKPNSNKILIIDRLQNLKKYHFEHYHFIVFDPNFVATFGFVGEGWKTIYECLEVNKPFFILNSRPTKYIREYKKFFENFFSISANKIFSRTIESKNPEFISGNPNKNMSCDFIVEESAFKKENNVKILHKIKKSDEVVGFNWKKRFLIPFKKLDKNSLGYIHKIVDKLFPFHQSIINFEQVCQLSNHLFPKKMFASEKFNFIWSRIDDYQKQFQDIKKKLSIENKKISNFIEEELPLLTSTGKELKLKTKTFLEKKLIEIHPNFFEKEKSILFSFKENKTPIIRYVICKIVGSSKNITILSENAFAKFDQEHIRVKQYLEQKLKKKDKTINFNKNIICLLIVNNATKLHPDQRKLKLPGLLKEIYSFKESNEELFKMITTNNLLKILKQNNGKELFFEQLVKTEQIEIIPKEN